MKKSICYVITQGEFGGAQRYVFDLATNIQDKFDIQVLIGPGKTELKTRLEKSGVKVMTAKHLVRNINPLKDFLAIFELKNMFTQNRPNIIHLNSGKAGFIGSIAARLAEIKNVIFTAHGFSFLEPVAWPMRVIYLWAEKLVRRYRKKIIAVSEFDRRQALKHHVAVPGQVVTIHNGIDLGKSENRKIGHPTSDHYDYPIIGTIAREHYKTKDLPTLKKAIDKVREKIPDAKLVILDQPDAAKFLSGLDVYVCSSVKEGFPYSVLEAMAAGLPIVSTSVGGIPEAITHEKEGLLVPPRDPNTLAQAIIRLCVDHGLAGKLGENAKEKVKTFSLEKMVRKTARVYESI